MNNTERPDKEKIADQSMWITAVFLYQILTKPAGDPSGNAEFRRIAWAHQAVGKERRTMTITDYFVALGGMLASLGCAGLVAAGLIRFRARH
jgi:hypothetical protein